MFGTLLSALSTLLAGFIPRKLRSTVIFKEIQPMIKSTSLFLKPETRPVEYARGAFKILKKKRFSSSFLSKQLFDVFQQGFSRQKFFVGQMLEKSSILIAAIESAKAGVDSILSRL